MLQGVMISDLISFFPGNLSEIVATTCSDVSSSSWLVQQDSYGGKIFSFRHGFKIYWMPSVILDITKEITANMLNNRYKQLRWHAIVMLSFNLEYINHTFKILKSFLQPAGVRVVCRVYRNELMQLPGPMY